MLPSLPTPSGAAFSGSTDVLLYLGAALILSVGGLLGVLFTRTAPLQSSLNDAFRSLTAELQTERSRLIARVSELEREREIWTGEVLRLSGRVRGLEQQRDSLLRLIHRAGIPLPKQDS